MDKDKYRAYLGELMDNLGEEGVELRNVALHILNQLKQDQPILSEEVDLIITYIDYLEDYII